MNPLQRLGLPAGAEARDVKREYATRLKDLRPDVDPEGFQQLHALYKAALQFVQWRDAEAVDDAPEFDAPVLDSAPEAAASPAIVAAPSFDFDAFYEDVVDLARRPDTGIADMHAFLFAQDALWELDTKAWVAQALIQRLHEEQPAISPSGFDALADFFSEWRVDRGCDAYGVIPLRDAVSRRWLGFPNAPAGSAVPTVRRSTDGGWVPIWPVLMGLLALTHLVRACDAT